MSYPAPPPAEQPPAERGSAAGRVDAGGFFSDLFDIRFTRFVSLRLISIVYVLILAAVSLFALVVVFAGFAQGAGAGLLALIAAALGWLIYVVLARVALEAFAVLFRIHDDTSRMAVALGAPGAGVTRGAAAGGAAAGAVGPRPPDPGSATTQVQQYPYAQGGGYPPGGQAPGGPAQGGPAQGGQPPAGYGDAATPPWQ
jgi:hypothetical protein